jgi:periplasmic protein CpxP/Spy
MNLNKEATMKINKVTRLWLLVTVMIGLASPLSWANDGRDKDRPFPHSRMIEELGLSQEQISQLKALHESNKSQFREKKKIVREKRDKLSEALRSEASEKVLWELFAQLQSARQAAGQARFTKILEIRKLLTPEQRKQFKGLRGKHHRKHNRDKKPSDH